MAMLSDVDNPRQPSNGPRHDFLELLVMMISAVLSDCDTIEDVAAWSRAHTAWLRKSFMLKNGVPSEYTFLRVFRRLDPKQFERCLRLWVSSLIPKLGGTVAVDGKTVRGIVPESDWSRCAVIAHIDSVRQVKGKPFSLEQRYYIASRNLAPAEVAEAVRSHWGIENQLHWVLDVTMKEDASTVRKDNAPENFSLLKKIVLNLLRIDATDTVKSSLRLKLKRAAWDDELRMRFLGLTSI